MNNKKEIIKYRVMDVYDDIKSDIYINKNDDTRMSNFTIINSLPLYQTDEKFIELYYNGLIKNSSIESKENGLIMRKLNHNAYNTIEKLDSNNKLLWFHYYTKLSNHDINIHSYNSDGKLIYIGNITNKNNITSYSASYMYDKNGLCIFGVDNYYNRIINESYFNIFKDIKTNRDFETMYNMYENISIKL